MDRIDSLRHAEKFADLALEVMSKPEPLEHGVFNWYQGRADGVRMMDSRIGEEVFPEGHPLNDSIDCYGKYKEWHRKVVTKNQRQVFFTKAGLDCVETQVLKVLEKLRNTEFSDAVISQQIILGLKVEL